MSSSKSQNLLLADQVLVGRLGLHRKASAYCCKVRFAAGSSGQRVRCVELGETPFLGRFAKVPVNGGYLTVAPVVMGMILGGWH